MDSAPYANKKRLAYAFLSYLLSAFAGALGLFNWLTLRDLQLKLVTHSSISRWSWQAIDNFSFLLFGMIWLSFVLFAQHYFAKGAENKQLLSRFAFIVGIQLLLLFTCQMIPMLLGIMKYNFSGMTLLAIEGIVGVGLLFLGGYLVQKRKNQNNGRQLI